MKLNKLESIRGLCALYVVIHHTNNFDGYLSYIFRFGQEAVIVFFLMSGFVINYSFENAKDKSFKTYFFKRFIRIYIPLIFVFTLMIAINGVGDVKYLLGNIFMLQDIDRLRPGAIVPPFSGNSPLWSLSYEWWFYMMYYPLSRFSSKQERNKIALFLFLTGSLFYLILPIYAFRVFLYFGIWWVGVELSYYYIRGELSYKAVAKSCRVLYIGFIVSLFSMMINFNHITSVGKFPLIDLRYFVISLVVVYLSFFCYKSERINLRFLDFIYPLGSISYVLYIAHVPIYNYMSDLGFNWVVFFCVTLLFSYMVECILYPPLSRKIKSLVFVTRHPYV